MHNPQEQFLEKMCPNCRAGTFIQNPYEHPSYVECNSCGAMQLTYVPMDHQYDFHKHPYRYNKDGSVATQTFGLFGGYGSAKSTASLQDFFHRALENPNGVGLITAPTLQLLKRTSIKTLLDEVIPPPLLKSYNKSENEMVLSNGYVIYAIPSDDETKLRSLNAGHVHMEEASGIKRTIYDQLLTRMRHKYTWNRCIYVCSNPENNWIKDVLVDNDKRIDPLHPEHEDYDPTITNFIWATALNYNLPEDFIPRLSKNKPQWWKEKFLEGSFDVASGMVYPNAGAAIIEDIPNFEEVSRTWEKCVAIDHGIRNPTACLFGAIDPVEGVLYIYHTYYRPDALLPVHAAAIKPEVEKIPSGRLRFMVGDPSMGNRSADVVNGKNVLELYQEYGLFFQKGNNRMEAGILRVNEYIESGRLKIFRSCVDLTREIINYKYKETTMDDAENRNLDERPIKNKDHSVDALRYMLMKLPENPADLVATSYHQSGNYTENFSPEMTQRVLQALREEEEYGENEEFESSYLGYV